MVPGWWRLAGIVPIFAGLGAGGRVAVLFSGAARPSCPGDVSSQLLTDGPFRVSRNPIYLGMVLVLAGIAIVLGSLTPWLALPVFVAVIGWNIIPVEEAMLSEAFGDAYSAYRAKSALGLRLDFGNERSNMAKKDPRIDAYIGKAPEFAKPILLKLRKAAHAGCPQVEEGIKWSVPAYLHNGILCMTAGFKQHCMLVFWNNTALKKTLKAKGDSGELLGKLRRIKQAADLPSDAVLKQLVKQAAALGSAGVKPVRPKKSKAAKAAVPADLKTALARTRKRRPPGQRQPLETPRLHRLAQPSQARRDPPETPGHGPRLDRAGQRAQLEVRTLTISGRSPTTGPAARGTRCSGPWRRRCPGPAAWPARERTCRCRPTRRPR